MAPEPMTDACETTVVDLSGATLIGTVCHKVWSCSMYLNTRGKPVVLSQVHNTGAAHSLAHNNMMESLMSAVYPV